MRPQYGSKMVAASFNRLVNWTSKVRNYFDVMSKKLNIQRQLFKLQTILIHVSIKQRYKANRDGAFYHHQLTEEPKNGFLLWCELIEHYLSWCCVDYQEDAVVELRCIIEVVKQCISSNRHGQGTWHLLLVFEVDHKYNKMTKKKKNCCQE